MRLPLLTILRTTSIFKSKVLPYSTVTKLTMQSEKVVRKDGSHLVACYIDEYKALLDAKVIQLKTLLNWDKPVDVYESEKTHFRMRANFQMWHDDPRKKTPEGFYFTMCDPGCPREPQEVTSFPRGTKLINRLMSDLLVVFRENDVIFQNLFEVRFLTTQTEQAIIVLLYKKPLPAEWQAVAEELCKKLNVKIVGRARKMMQVAGGDETVIERYTVKGSEFQIFQTEGAFSQPNAGVCEKMLTWAMDRTEGSGNEDLLELYCGGGTFTAPLSKNFRNVLATEISKASVDLAHKTFALNSIQNIKIARLSSEEFSEAYSGKKAFTRLSDNGINLKSYEISTVVVDPPRAGMDPATCRLISQFAKIVYISCNPETLARDVEMLRETHDVVRVAAFDQFPYTHHLEGGVFLLRRPDAVVPGVISSSAPDAGEVVAAEIKKEEKDVGEGVVNVNNEEEQQANKKQRTD